MIKEVVTSMDPEFVSDVLLEVYRKWIEFALGSGELGGKMYKYRSKYNPGPAPSGAMAAALRAETDKNGNVVALYIDKDSMGSADADLLMSGHRGFSLKDKMLKGGRKGVKRSKAGYLYRRIPIASSPKNPGATFGEASHIVNLLTSSVTPQGGMIHVNKNLAKLWVRNKREAHNGSVNIRTMSNKPGSARWWIPQMRPFNAGHILKSMLKNQSLKDRIII
jgi:hypothetical protein